MLLIGCQSGDQEPGSITPSPDFEHAQLIDFPLFEVSYLDITIVHPVLVNGVETKHGKIEIIIPYTQKSLQLSLKRFDLDGDKYHISPSVGEQRDFSVGAVTYAIFSNFHESKAVHYDVTIMYGGELINENTKITGFRFEQRKNPGLSATVEANKIIEYTSYSENAIYVIVPVGTDFTSLTPTITYNAAKLYYAIDATFQPYPANGLAVDFKYPKHFYLQAENSFGVKSKVYDVIVEVNNPIKIEQSLIVTANVKKGDGMASEYFSGSVKWTNQGNHPITGMAAKEYINKLYPVVGLSNANIITASLSNPVGGMPGVLPGEKGDVNVKVTKVAVTGMFKTTVVFAPTFSFDSKVISYWPAGDRVEDIFEFHPFTIQATVED